MSKPPKIVAIVVAYQPDRLALRHVLAASASQVLDVVVVDNTPIPDQGLLDCCPGPNNVHLISLGDNLGVAHAHNLGIEWAQARGADYVLLLDQDSQPGPGMVVQLLTELESATLSGTKAAAIGPVSVDARTGVRSYFMTTRLGFPIRHHPVEDGVEKPPVGVTYLISSGTLISMQSLLVVGGMRSRYFIDLVDTEWGMRARSKGYEVLGSARATMTHTLGDSVRRIWLLRMRNVAYHSPLRDYYQFRNTLLMLRDVSMSTPWRIRSVFRLLPLAIYFLVLAPERRSRLVCMLLGLYHGLRGVGGRLDQVTGRCTEIPSTRLDPGAVR